MPGEQPVLTDMRTAYSEALIREGNRNPDVVVTGADTTDSLKTSKFGREFPDRFFNVGIAEGNLVTMSAGLAASGKTVFASTYAIFLPGRAVDQIRNNVAYPSPGGRGGLNVKLVASHGGLSVGPDGGSHQQLEDISIMRTIPNFRVMIPADTVAVSALTRMMAAEYGPFYMRMARSKTPLVYDERQWWKRQRRRDGRRHAVRGGARQRPARRLGLHDSRLRHYGQHGARGSRPAAARKADVLPRP